jgi:hypothetical protein
MAQFINEAKRFQKLANIREAEENQSMDPKSMMDAEKKAFQIANSSQFNAAMEKEWAKLSDEDRKKLAQSISSLNEAVGSDFSSFHKMVQKAEEEAGINEETSDTQALIGNILGNIGMLNTTGFAGMPGAMIAAALGVSASYMLPVYLASFAAGSILWWLGRKIAGEKSNVDEAVNEALNKDIKAFGQDLGKYLTNAGFKVKYINGRLSDEDMKQLKTNTGLVALESDQNATQQSLYMNFNPKDLNKIEGIVNKFQLSPYTGKVMTKGWTSKQVVGALNPGDIFKADSQKGSGLYQFFRLAKVDTKVQNVQKESIEQAVNEALARFRRTGK